MNLEDLRAAQAEERASDSLQPLPPTFYEQAADFLAERRDERDRLADRSDDPFGAEDVRRLTDEIETAEEVVEAIYERRVGKVVKRASLAAAGMPADEEGLTDEERSLFRDLVARIEANRATVLAVLEAEDDDGSGSDQGPATGADGPASTDRSTAETEAAAAPPTPPPDDPERSLDASSAMAAAGSSEDAEEGSAADAEPSAGGGEHHPEPDGGSATAAGGSAPGPEGAGTGRLTVRITADVGEVYGVDDRVYTLGREDVVSLPEPNARPLLDRDAAHLVD